MNWLLLTGLLLLAATAALDLAAGRRAASIPYWLAAAACVCLAICGIGALTDHPVAPTAASVLAMSDGGFGTDPLTGLFLLIAFAIAAPICLCRSAYPTPETTPPAVDWPLRSPSPSPPSP